jgi:hypothetical protein
MRIHPCPVCGHEIRHDGDTKVEHLPNGGHRWVATVKVGQSWGGKRA